MKAYKVYLGLGSNVGDRLKFIESAIERIGDLDGVKLTKKASLYETEPWGVKDQGFFLNTAVEIETSLSPEDLHNEIKSIEQTLGRESREKWTQREIDIDLLFYGDRIIDEDNLKVPHNRIEDRRFVLVPLAEMDPDLIHPVLNKSVKELLTETKDNLEVSKYTENVQEKFGE